MTHDSYEVQLGFVPVAAKPSNYPDCKAVASDGSLWVSVGGIWKHRVVRKHDSAVAGKSPGRTREQDRPLQSVLHGVFIGCVIIGVFMGPVKMMGPYAWGAFWGVIVFGVVAGVVAYAVSNKLGKSEEGR